MFEGVEILVVFDRGGERRLRALTVGVAVTPLGGHFHQREDVDIDDAQVRLRAQLAAQQSCGFEIAVDFVAAAGEEPGDEHALEGADVELGADRRFDGDLVVAGAGGRQGDRENTTNGYRGSSDH